MNKKNKINNLSKANLARIYRGAIENWNNGKRILVVNRPFNRQIRAEFYKKILNSKPTKKFFKRGSPIPIKMMIQQSSLATIKFISRIPNALGYIYLSQLTDEVKVLSINNARPENNDYLIK
ncbi:MAG: substrate-binding domain-containing protein [Nitrospinales bacterium]